jgi:hypothetical protein
MGHQLHYSKVRALTVRAGYVLVCTQLVVDFRTD